MTKPSIKKVKAVSLVDRACELYPKFKEFEKELTEIKDELKRRYNGGTVISGTKGSVEIIESTNVGIHPLGAYKVMKRRDFFSSVSVLIGKARKYLSKEEFEEISFAKDPTFSVKIKPNK